MRLSYILTMLFGLGLCFGASAQNFTSTLLDAETGNPVPFATIEYAVEKGVITNEEGSFSFYIEKADKPLDSIYISCMGYERKGFSPRQLKDSVIYLQPKGFSLVGVDLMGKGLTADEIMDRMIDSIPVNYNQMAVQKKFFLRQSTFDELQRAKIDLKQSTIPFVNPMSVDSIINALPKVSEYHTETLGMMHKHDNNVKLQVLKATEMYDKDKQATLSNLNYRLRKVLKEHVKEDSYFKFKTGPLSTKADLDTLIGRPNLEAANAKTDSISTSIKEDYLQGRVNRLARIEDQVFGKKSRLDIIGKRNRYEFVKEETIEHNDERYYVLTFNPKNGSKLKGKLFINALDFALVRVEYENISSIKKLKLFGIDYQEPKYQGTAEFAKMKNGKYELSFSRLKHDFYLDAERPVKIVEKNKYVKGRRKQNEVTLDLYITVKSSNIYEWTALETKGSSKSAFDMVPQREIIEVIYKTKYDDSYWDGITIVAPDSALRDFSIASTK